MARFLRSLFWYIFVTLPESVFIFCFYFVRSIFFFCYYLFCLPLTALLFSSKVVSDFSNFFKRFLTSYALVWPTSVRRQFSRIALILTFPLDLTAGALLWMAWVLKFLVKTVLFVLCLAIFSIFLSPLIYFGYLIQLSYIWLVYILRSILLFFLACARILFRFILLGFRIYGSLNLVWTSFAGFKRFNWRALFRFIRKDLELQQFGSLINTDKITNFRNESRVLDLVPYHAAAVPKSSYYPFGLYMNKYYFLFRSPDPFSSAVRLTSSLDALRWYKVFAPLSASIGRRVARLAYNEVSVDSLYYSHSFPSAEQYLKFISFLRYSFLSGTLLAAPYSWFSNRYISFLLNAPKHFVSWFEQDYDFVLLDSIFSYNLYDSLSPTFRGSVCSLNRRPAARSFLGSVLEGSSNSKFYDLTKPKQLTGVESLFFVDDLDYYNHGLRAEVPDRFWFKRLLKRPSAYRDPALVESVPEPRTALLAYIQLFRHNVFWIPIISVDLYQPFRLLAYGYIRFLFFLHLLLHPDLRLSYRSWSVFKYELSNELFRIFVYIPIYFVGIFQRLRRLVYRLDGMVYSAQKRFFDRFKFMWGRLTTTPLCDLVHGEFLAILVSIKRYSRNRVFEIRRYIFGVV